MKILITGACGHIGSYISENADKIKGVKELILIDNLESTKINSLFDKKRKVNTKFYKMDVAMPDTLSKFKKIDFVIHCASLTNAEKSFGIRKIMFKNNLNCMKNIINFSKKNNAKLIHLSSTSVYGVQKELVDEDDDSLLKPQSPYAKIKILEEKMIKKEKKNLKYMCFRFGTIAGVSKGMRFHTAINKFCLDASLGKKIKIYKTAFNQFRPYLSLRDAFKIFKLCIERKIFLNETYNVHSGNFTVKEIIQKIKKFKRKIKIKFVKSKIMNQLSYKVDKTKIEKLGIKLNTNIQDDIKQTLKILNFKNEM
tara:strand:- start:1263 stop:2192 length:930 start_codon:yes stop_codon:yes gene_type:complete